MEFPSSVAKPRFGNLRLRGHWVTDDGDKGEKREKKWGRAWRERQNLLFLLGLLSGLGALVGLTE